MRFTATANRKLLAIALVLLLIAGGCTPGQGDDSTRLPDGASAVDAVFTDFYKQLGGKAILGYAITPVMEYGQTKEQYTEAALLRYDPTVGASQQYSLAALGQQLQLSDQPIVLPSQEDERIIDGYIIYNEFTSTFDALQGVRYTGRPLTQARIDYDRGRIEQYFENVGFYRLLSDPPNSVHLLAYGLWKCDTFCRYSGDPAAQVSPQPVFPEPFVSSLARLGTGFSGRPLSEPYMAADGMLEQIYENIVVAADPTNLRAITLRPIPAEVGFPPTELVSKQDDDRMVFYPIRPGLGHHIPGVFETYIIQHGGMELSGMPATELFQEGTVYRQCFTNYCLDYDQNALESLRIRLAPLGQLYQKLHPPVQEAGTPVTASPTNYRVNTWEELPLVASGAQQAISIQVTDVESQAPVPNVDATINLYLPSGNQTNYHFQPTDKSGQASVTLPPINAKNGTLVPYQVCVNPSSISPVCVRDSYVIWGQ